MIRLSTRPGLAGIVVLLALSALLASVALGSDGPRAVSWRADLAQAQAEARDRDLPLWLQFTGPWCSNCRRMERGAFVSPPVVAASRDRFVPVKLRSDEFEQLAVSLGLSSLPATVIVRPDGEVVERREGYSDPAEFLAFLDTMTARADLGPKKGATAEIALASYCPVNLVEQKRLVPGRATLTTRHGGVEYRFADETSRLAFLAAPHKYAPANRGDCPVRHVDGGAFQPGDPRFGVIYRGHLYLCADEAGRAKFVKNPERYANVDLAARHACPHCWTRGPQAQVAQSPGRPAPTAATRSTPLPTASTLLEAFLAPVARLRR